jgi:hypothetical protein
MNGRQTIFDTRWTTGEVSRNISPCPDRSISMQKVTPLAGGSLVQLPACPGIAATAACFLPRCSDSILR